MRTIQLFIDGRTVSLPQGTTVLEAIRKAGLYVPTLCHDPDLKPFGACRLCIVHIEGMGRLQTACTTPVQEGMVVTTETEEIHRIRRTIIEMALADHPSDCLFCQKSDSCKLLKVARYLGVDKSSVERFHEASLKRPVDTSNPAYDMDPNKCILCGICVRACDELQGLGAIDFAFRGHQTRISPFWATPIAISTCQTCGECVERCPTGALTPKQVIFPQREVQTICPYCGVGCAIEIGVKGGDIVRVKGVRASPVNRGGLCVKGRYGLDFITHPDRLTKPLIRKEGVSKKMSPDEPLWAFREATWDEALELLAEKLSETLDRSGFEAVGVLSSAKCTNEENYLIQKFARAVLGTNNVDHCARLCHASTVVGALAAFGDGAMSNSISDIDKADLFFVIGSNTTECHPIIGRRLKRALKMNGTKLIVADPRSIELTEIADIHLNQKPGTDVALLNGIMRQIIGEGLQDDRFIKERCEAFEPFMESLDSYSPEKVEDITRVPGDLIRKTARLFGKAKRAIVFYGMGITQHTTGTDNVKAIANLLMLTGNLGRNGTGFSPLRGQNNVQGACDMGALPNVFPGYQSVNDPQVRAKFQEAWKKDLSTTSGLTLTDMFRVAQGGRLKALYVVGENPLMSEPDLSHAREAMAKLDFLAVQDIFLTETAQFADLVLPAASFAEKNGTFTNTERRVQLIRKALEPPGEARVDWEIISALATRMGYPMNYGSSADIMLEIAELTPIYGGISHDRLTNKWGIQWPCWNRKHPGTPTLHQKTFTRGRGKFHQVYDQPPAERPSKDYPMLLTTGRVLEHWHTGSLSHRSHTLETLIPGSVAEISPFDAARLGIREGDLITINSRRGKVRTKAKETKRVQPGLAFMAFHWGDAPANLLTNPAVDPLAKIPEFKVASAKVILTALEKAAEENEFFQALVDDPLKALESYNLTPEQKYALAVGDMEKIEAWVGPLEERLKTWLKAWSAREKA